jgi:hypothetical protein
MPPIIALKASGARGRCVWEQALTHAQQTSFKAGHFAGWFSELKQFMPSAFVNVQISTSYRTL